MNIDCMYMIIDACYTIRDCTHIIIDDRYTVIDYKSIFIEFHIMDY